MAGQLTMSQLGNKLGVGITERDLAYIKSLNPGLSSDIDTNKQAIKAYIKLNERAKEVAKFEEDYRAANHGVLDPGFRSALQKWADEHPLFSAEEKKSSSAPVAAFPYTPQQAAEELKRRRAGAQ